VERCRTGSQLPHVDGTGMKGAQYVQYFGPLLDALRSLGGSGTPDEIVERISQDLNTPDDVQNEVLHLVS
jgi:hypothetical protein